MAPTSKSAKLKRLVAVQRHLEKMAENELASLSRQRQDVIDDMDVVVQAINSIDPIHRLFSRNYSDRYSRLTIRERQLQGMQQIGEMKVLRERTKADRLEDNMKKARALEDRDSEDKAIYDLLEILLATQTTASSKVGDP